MSAISGLLNFGNAYSEAENIKAEGAFQKRMFDTNAQLGEMKSTDAIRRGEKEISQYRTGVKKLIGSQRTSYAAQGVVVNSGSAETVQEDTAALAADDVRTMRNNAALEAFGYKMQSIQDSAQGRFAAFSAENRARSTMLTGYAGFAGSIGKTAATFAGTGGGGSGGGYDYTGGQASVSGFSRIKPGREY